MTVLITLSDVGSDAGPTFNLYGSSDGTTFASIVEGIDKTELEAGYEATVPDGTTNIKVTSVGDCTSSHFATINALHVFGHDIDQSFAYCVDGFCELDAPVTNVALYSLDETLVTGSYVYTDPELQYIYTTAAIISNGQYLFNVDSGGQLSMTCTVGIEC